MCGRFTQDAKAQATLDMLAAMDVAASSQDEAATRYNLAPTQRATVVLCLARAPLLQARQLRFGMPRGESGQVINARAETLTQRPMFRGLLRWHRCLVVASGFYEWRQEGSKKQPFYFQRADKGPFYFAGLRQRGARDNKDGQDLAAAGEAAQHLGFVIVTTAANDVVGDVHPRMPVMLEGQSARSWVDWDTEVQDALTLLSPYCGAMRAHPVATTVNSPRHDAPDCIAPLSS